MILFSGPVDLKVIGFNRSDVQVAWLNPPLTAVPSLPYEITVQSINPEFQIDYFLKAFRLEEKPFMSIDLSGYECRMICITVAVLGHNFISYILLSLCVTSSAKREISRKVYGNKPHLW